jgi:integrase
MKREPGSISSYRDATGTWRHRVRMYVEGRQESYGVYDSREEAELALEALRKKLAPVRQPVGMSLLKWGEEWLDRREADGLHRSVKDSRSIFRTHIAAWELAGVPMRKLKRTDVVTWVKGLLRKEANRGGARGIPPENGRAATRSTPPRADVTSGSSSVHRLSRQTVLNAFNLLHRMLGDAADEGKVSSNVASGVKVPKVPREDEPWTWLMHVEIKALLALDLPPEQRAIFTLAIYTGLRPGELFGLRWADVTDTELVVRRSYNGATKGGRVRRVPLLEPARAALKAWRRGIGQALVFPGKPTPRYPNFKGCHAKGFTAGFEDLIGQVVKDRPVRFYDLRHTCASNLIQGTLVEGLPPMRLEDVQLWLGHKSRTTTERYAHLCPDRLHGLVTRHRQDTGGNTEQSK